jgi:hypothetical protein
MVSGRGIYDRGGRSPFRGVRVPDPAVFREWAGRPRQGARGSHKLALPLKMDTVQVNRLSLKEKREHGKDSSALYEAVDAVNGCREGPPRMRQEQGLPLRSPEVRQFNISIPSHPFACDELNSDAEVFFP